MSIIYYPNRVYRAKEPAIDRVMAKRNPVLATGAANIASNALSVVISSDCDWNINSVGWQFSNASPREYSAAIRNGRKVVENLNDYLWISCSNVGAQRVILNPGFYTGTQLATELQTRLNAATFLDGSTNAFNTAGITFTVVYNAAAGTYTITPVGATIRYLSETGAPMHIMDSIAGHLFGFNTTTAFAATLTSDTTVFGLDWEIAIVDVTNGALSYLHNDLHIMDVDQALHLASNAGTDVTLTYVVDYEKMV